MAIHADGRIAQQLRLPTGFGPAAVLETVVTAVTQLAALCETTIEGFTSIGIGIPGAVDNGTGRVTHAVNLGLDGLDLGAELSARLGRSGADRERRQRRGDRRVPPAREGSVALDGLPQPRHGTRGGPRARRRTVRRGSRGTAGEIGHIPVDPNGPECP